MMTDSRLGFVDAVADWFWPIIDNAKQDTERLKQSLAKLSARDIEIFCHDYWNVTYELTPTHSDEERQFDEEDILLSSAWVVNQGKHFYEAVFADPTLLPHPKTLIHLYWLSVAADLCFQLYNYSPKW